METQRLGSQKNDLFCQLINQKQPEIQPDPKVPIIPPITPEIDPQPERIIPGTRPSPEITPVHTPEIRPVPTPEMNP